MLNIVDVNKGAIIDLQINYHMMYEMYWLWEELILESANLGPWNVHFETPSFNSFYA